MILILISKYVVEKWEKKEIVRGEDSEESTDWGDLLATLGHGGTWELLPRTMSGSMVLQ